MHADELQGALFGLALVAFAGRVALAWLPPGEPGRHRPAELPATWAASHLLGWIALHTATATAAELGARLSWQQFAAPFALLAVARLATLPGAMVPRHDLRAERATPLARALLLALAVALLFVPALAVRAGELGVGRGPASSGELDGWRAASPAQAYVLRLLAPAHAVALAVIAHHAMAALAVRRSARCLGALAVLALAALAARAGAELDARLALGFGAGVALGLCWFRRADPRALALACLAFASCLAAAPAGAPLGLAGLAALLAALHPNAYRRGLGWSLAALAVALPWQLVRMALELEDCTRADLWLSSDALGPRAWLAALLDWRAGGPLWLALPVAAAVAWRRAHPADRRGERFAIGALGLAALAHAPLVAAQACLVDLDGTDWSDLCRWTAPAAILLLALALGSRSP
jgi:hypothetical protein